MDRLAGIALMWLVGWNQFAIGLCGLSECARCYSEVLESGIVLTWRISACYCNNRCLVVLTCRISACYCNNRRLVVLTCRISECYCKNRRLVVSCVCVCELRIGSEFAKCVGVQCMCVYCGYVVWWSGGWQESGIWLEDPVLMCEYVPGVFLRSGQMWEE